MGGERGTWRERVQTALVDVYGSRGRLSLPLISVVRRSKVRGESRTPVRHCDQLQNKLLNFYHLRTKLPSSALLFWVLFVSMCWGCALVVDQCLSFIWSRLIYRVHGKLMVWFIWCVTCSGRKDSHKSHCGGEDTEGDQWHFCHWPQNMRSWPKQPCHKITYTYTSHSEMSKTECQTDPRQLEHHPTMRYSGICFVAQKIITMQQKNVHPFNPKSWKILVNLDWNQNV